MKVEEINKEHIESVIIDKQHRLNINKESLKNSKDMNKNLLTNMQNYILDHKLHMFKGEMAKYSLNGLTPVYNHSKVQFDDTKLFAKNDND